MSVIIASCPCCKNYTGNKENPFMCKAFSDGIPKEYYWGPTDVEKIAECANGYKFEDKYKKNEAI